MAESILNLFASRVKEKRHAKKISQEKLAELSGLHRTYIGMIERSEKNITIVNVKKIADALNVKLSELLDD